MKKLFFSFLIIMLFSSPVFGIIEQDSMKIYAVTTKGEGLVATLKLEIEDGEGKVWSAVSPLVGTSTQKAERTAVIIAKEFFPNIDKYDYKFTISSNASVVEGPSAGAAMALLTVAMLTNKNIPDHVSITGTINEDGSIGPVGGVFKKTQEASETGMKLFLIPRGEAIQTVKLDEGVRSVNLLEYAPATWGIKVAEVETIEDALRLAFIDVADIDVNIAASSAVPDFVPEKLKLSLNLGSFKILTTNYLKETRQIVGEARNALSSTLIEDPEVTSFMLSVLNDSEQTISQAEILNEQNYLYSAANFGFLARVNAISVKELSNNPSLLEENSTALDLKLLELNQELNNFENDLSGNIPKEGAEWFASAQQRFTYSRLTVDKLLTTQEVVVDGTEQDVVSVSLTRLQDYSFAVAWLDVSKDFYNLSQESSGLVQRVPDFNKSIDPLLVDAENGLAVIEEESPRDDIERRINSSKIEKKKGWFEASLFDAVSAKALVNAELDSEDKDVSELKALLEEKIASIEKKIADSNVSIGWAVLFLDHSKYFLYSANYYADKNLTISASNNLKSGLGLAYLADGLFDSADAVLQTYSSKIIIEENSGPIPVGPENGPSPLNDLLLVGGLFFFFVFLLTLTLLLIALTKISKHKNLSLRSDIPRLKILIKRVDERFLRNEIDSKTHSALKEKYVTELSFLESERKEKAMHVLAVDDYSSEISSNNEKIVALKKHLREGIVSKKEFIEKSKEYIEKIDNLKARLKGELNAISDQKKHLQGLSLDSIVNKKTLLPVPMKKESLVVVEQKPSVKKPVSKIPKKPSKPKLVKPKLSKSKDSKPKKKGKFSFKKKVSKKK